ncbi:hypothetical protein LSH36_190g03009 [Paralvinella palmiformis]|uniref:Uncharacterized protein n=1 Tax=Paralvinella palmiformis TaxID=53620 RepID=A0AAD9N759_9ANNE|nr:hypothetical protein LSH36_190g03009 [Paralvinella palmiformis]
MYIFNIKRQQPFFITLIVASALLVYFYVAYIHSHVHGNVINSGGINGSRQTCTLARLKSYVHQHSNFPGEGQWIEASPVYFRPTFCHLSYPRIPKRQLARCLIGNNISYIVTLGDSNAARYFVSINKALAAMATNKRCRVTKIERPLNDGFLPDLEYFANGSKANRSWASAVGIHNRQCRGCSSIKSACSLDHGGKEYEVVVEQAAMTSTLDDSIRVIGDGEAPTAQEFWLKHYLKDSYPDLLLIFLPFSHDKHSYSLIQIKAAITYFHNLVRTYVPIGTRVVYFPAFSEFENARKSLLYINRTYGGLLAAEKLSKMNNILYEVIHDDISEPATNINGFVDLFSISLSRQRWSTDGIHMKDVWYDVVVSMFWHTICER